MRRREGVSKLQTHSKMDSPGLSRSNGGHPHAFVPIWLVLPRRDTTNLVCLICITSPFSNGGCASSGGFGAR